MVLVVMLAMIVLVTIVVMAFFANAMTDREIETSRSQQIEAEQLANTGTDYVTGLLRREIADNSDFVDGVYFPKANTNMVPQRSISVQISPTGSDFLNLIRQSVAEADPNASSVNTETKARNGRTVSAARWNAPRLLGGAGFATSNQLPTWVYVTSSGGLTNIPGPDVIGRFAYNVYDIGGLLDANVAGYDPSVIGASGVSELKSSSAGADLTQIGISAPGVAALINFRAAGAPAQANNFGDWLKSARATGFLTTVVTNGSTTFTNNYFTSRQDLLRYARLQNTNIVRALPYLTHFSRAVARPSWKPATETVQNQALAGLNFSASGTLTHYTDSCDPIQYPVSTNDPLLQRRFSLGKLAWLTPQGPRSGISGDLIRACFGLRWDVGSEQWDYVGSYGDIPSEIKTLADIAKEPLPREPNFFELLKAGIVSGSLGSASAGQTAGPGGTVSTSMCSPGNATLDANKDLQVLKIGANIIDNADADNFPTIISLFLDGTQIERAGVEDLPYFFSLDMANLRVLTMEDYLDSKGKTRQKAIFTMSEFVWAPELFNPHRPTNTIYGPDELKVQIMSGDLNLLGFGENGSASGLRFPMDPSKPKALSALPAIDIRSGTLEKYRNGPSPVRDSSLPNRLGALIPSASDTDIAVFHLFSHSNPADYPPGFPAEMTDAPSKMAIIQVSNLIVSLRYKTPNGSWKTYSTLGGYEELPVFTGISGCYQDDFTFFCLKQSCNLKDQASTTAINSPYLAPWDPRSSRYGPAFIRYRRLAGAAPLFSVTTGQFLATPAPFYPTVYFVYPGSGAPRTGFIANMPQIPAFHDPDYEQATGPRPPDGNVGFVFPGTSATAANPYKSVTNMDPRPVILQRPYQTVAELGYVFRDIPWQTLNFWNDRSGDNALLDLFSTVDEPPVVAGMVSLNTRQPLVRQALFNGTGQLPDGSLPLTAPSLSTALGSFTYANGFVTTNAFANPADLARFMSSTPYLNSSPSPIKYRREATVRALGATQTRTWNIFVDIVAQAGRFPGTSSSPENFAVEGECRIWTSLAIDRFTGKVVDRSSEHYND